MDVDYLQKNYRLLLYTAIFFIYYILFLNQANNALSLTPYVHFPSDLRYHLEESVTLHLYKNFEPLFHIITHILMAILGFLLGTPQLQNLANSGAIVLALAKLLEFHILKKIMDENTDWREPIRLFFTVAIMLCSGLVLPFLNTYNYLAFGSPNVLHNPTLIVLTPLALAFFYMYIKDYIIRENFPHKFKKSIILSILLLLASFAKPSFTNIMIITIAITYLAKPKKFLTRSFYQDLIIFTPATILLLTQMYLIKKYMPDQAGLMWAPFKVINQHTAQHHIILALLRVFEFPLLIGCLYSFLNKQYPRQYLFFSWIFTLVAYFIYLFFSFQGRGWSHANLIWSCNLALLFLYTFTIIDYANLIKNTGGIPIKEIYINIIIVNFSWIFLSGIFYFVNIFLGYSYR